MEKTINLVRALVQDLSQKGKEEFTFYNETTFTLTESHLISGSITKLYVNNVEKTIGFTVDYDNCKVTITLPLNVGDSIEIPYNYYEQYSDEEIKKYINATFAYLSVNEVCVEDFEITDENGTDDIYPTPNKKQRRLIALLSAILIEGNLRSYRTPDFTITYERDVPKEQRIKDVIRDYKSRIGVFAIIEKDIEIE